MPGSAPTRSCAKCRGELTFNWREDKAGYLWVCARGDPNWQFTWSGALDLNKLMTAFETRLCLNCQQEALTRAEGPDALEMPQVPRPDLGIRGDLRAGGYNPDRTHQWMENGRP